MKKIFNITETDINRLVKNVINEMYENLIPLSIKEWSDVWFKLRKISPSFHYPDDDGVYVFGGLDFFISEDGTHLTLNEFLRDPYSWREEYDKGAKVLEDYYKKLRGIFDESGLGIKIHMGPKFKMVIYMDDTPEEMYEGWSEKYKRSIDCNHPKGFSQRAHCQGRKKRK